MLRTLEMLQMTTPITIQMHDTAGEWKQLHQVKDGNYATATEMAVTDLSPLPPLVEDCHPAAVCWTGIKDLVVGSGAMKQQDGFYCLISAQRMDTLL
mmetsp:Transcript_3572/g.7892  ORF Transcript_3572/g.7892 Transcript_3572/m.7892 type:complete len:97 (-) Transcript_3572:342-632(-)